MDTNKPNPDPTLEFIWAQYKVWSATASKLKKELTLWRMAAFALTLLGAFTAIVSQNVATLGPEWLSQGLGWISAAAVGIAGYAGGKVLTSDKEKRWIQARAAAQQCKSDAYLYLLQVPPYAGREGETLLFSRVENLIRSLYTIPQVSIPKEAESKDLPLAGYSLHDYLEERIQLQAKEYYFPKAERYRKFVRRAQHWGIGLGIMGFLLGSLGALGKSEYLSVWVAFISTVSASITSFVGANRYQYLAMSFQVTANQLMVLWAKGNRIRGESEEVQKDFIKTCEAILSTENETWIAELSREEARSNTPEGDAIAEGASPGVING
jgi:hypothetical protein